MSDLHEQQHVRPKRLRASDPIIRAVARELDLPMVHVQRVVGHYLEVLRDEVWQRKRVLVPKLGVFRIRRRKARAISTPPGREPSRIDLPEIDTVSFRASKNWRTR